MAVADTPLASAVLANARYSANQSSLPFAPDEQGYEDSFGGSGNNSDEYTGDFT
jgi:hypothetical protein